MDRFARKEAVLDGVSVELMQPGTNALSDSVLDCSPDAVHVAVWPFRRKTGRSATEARWYALQDVYTLILAFFAC